MRRSNDILFSEAAREWLEYAQAELKYSSIARYTNILKLHLLPEFADVSISEITRERVFQYRGKLLTGDGTSSPALSTKTIGLIFSVLRSIVSFSIEEKGCKGANLGSITIRQQYKPLRVFSLQEQQQLNQYLTENLSFPNIGMLLALYTGMRIGELCALRWKDLDLDGWSIHVRKTMQRVQTFQEDKKTHVIITDPKSIASIRQIPIPDFLHKLLTAAQQKPDCFLLTGEIERHMEPRSLEYQFSKAMKACDIRGATFHTLRHTFATRCIEQGFDVKTLSEILGHANVTITMNRYVHPTLEFKRENMNKLSSLIDESLLFSQYMRLCEKAGFF